MTLFEMLTLRSEFEDITLNYKIPGSRKAGTLSNLKWFVSNAHEKNRRREGFKRAIEIATLIVENETARKKMINEKKKNGRRTRIKTDETTTAL